MDKLFIVLHHHGHGVDVIPVLRSEEPTTEEQEALCDDFDPDAEDALGGGEYTEVRGPWEMADLQ